MYQPGIWTTFYQMRNNEYISKYSCFVKTPCNFYLYAVLLMGYGIYFLFNLLQFVGFCGKIYIRIGVVGD